MSTAETVPEILVIKKKVIDNETGKEQWVENHLLRFAVYVVHGVGRTALIAVVCASEAHSVCCNIANTALVDFARGDDCFGTHRKEAEETLANRKVIALALDNAGETPCGDSAPS